MSGLRAGFGPGHSNRTLRSGQSALLCLRVGCSTQPGRGRHTNDNEGRALDNLGQVKNRIPWGRTCWPPIPSPSHLPQKSIHFPSPKRGPVIIIHLLCALPPNTNPISVCEVGLARPLAEGEDTWGSALREDASSLLSSKGFPNQLIWWWWHEESSQMLGLAFFPVHYLRPLLLTLTSLLSS